MPERQSRFDGRIATLRRKIIQSVSYTMLVRLIVQYLSLSRAGQLLIASA